ncbi:hypothetical protein AAV32_05845 [Kerstersia gyiorum]|uniref:Uncharacterized protein n=2 Tax=Kerstersia gyiorum TaxID=206506 RepID=A0A171KUI7_9BURK|nr:hypothetical protein AAV32_05845 [Kerstersia gyiorum]
MHSYTIVHYTVHFAFPIEMAKIMSHSIRVESYRCVTAMSTEFDARVALLVKELVEDHKNLLGRGFWNKLEEASGIKARTWRNLYEQRQRATNEIIAALGKLRPQYAFWLITGVTDAANGHIAPATATTFPERAHVGDAFAEQYFESSIEFKEQVLRGQTDTLESSIKALERTSVFSQWWDSVLVDTIYDECTSDLYQRVRRTWQKRESERGKHVARLSQQNKDDARGFEVPVPDPRTAHQHPFFMFYEPRHDDTKD